VVVEDPGIELVDEGMEESGEKGGDDGRDGEVATVDRLVPVETTAGCPHAASATNETATKRFMGQSSAHQVVLLIARTRTSAALTTQLVAPEKSGKESKPPSHVRGQEGDCSADRTRIYNQWVNSPAQTFRPVPVGAVQYGSVYDSRSVVLSGVPLSGDVRLHNWLQVHQSIARHGVLAVSGQALVSAECRADHAGLERVYRDL
jgi:hypothetical protein